MQSEIEKLVNIDFGKRRIDLLHAAAVRNMGAPPAYLAAQELMKLEPQNYVLIATGSVTRGWISPNIGETDGPIGAAVLARALHISFGIIPIIITESGLCDSMAVVMRSAGFTVVATNQLHLAGTRGSPTSVSSILGFPDDYEKARLEARRLLETYSPNIVLSVERLGRNALGVYHNSRGEDCSLHRARVDALIEEAMARKVFTICVADGGNDIGMGKIRDSVIDVIPYGAKCTCPCGGGIAAVASADILVTATVSNWGCYAIIANLAIEKRDKGLLHSGEMEAHLIKNACAAGLIDGISGRIEYSVDGFSISANTSMVDLIYQIACKAI